MKRIVIFASGNGTNAQRIMNHFKGRSDIEVAQVLSNNKSAKVLERAAASDVSTTSFNRNDFYKTDTILGALKNIEPDLIVLAGFLWLFPEKIINAFPDRVINIHPALLPNFGGKGMYGKYVHEAVYAFAKANPEQKHHTGITIHKVTPEYDKGEYLLQAKVAVTADDTPESIAQKVHKLEYKHFPKVIEQILTET